MRASQEFIKQLEQLYEEYEQEVTENIKAGILKKSTGQTYLYHSDSFIRWCRNEFEPGERNKKN